MEVRDLWPAIFVELGVLKNRFLIGLLEKIELWLYRKAIRVVTVTDSFRQDLIRRGVPPEKVINIPNGADIDYWQPREGDSELKKRLGLEDKFIVLYIGAHGISHALSKVLECAGMIEEHREIHFLFVGDGAEKPALQDYAQRRNLTNVTFHESVDKEAVKSFYSLCDVCLVPLRDIPLFDSFIPSKMFEIMAMGRPIVAGLKGEAAGIVRQSEGGLIVKPENPGAMQKAILKLYKDRALCREFGENGRMFVCAEFSRETLADKYLKVLQDAVQEYHN
jgi:glycosyltransferase involved in cell wall biosynthesis